MTTTFVPVERAKQHPITLDKPAVNFFEGALLGNGGLGVVVTTRPDSVLLHFGHNNVWDIRVAEKHQDKIGTFKEIFEKVRSISPDLSALEDDLWYAEYLKLTEENYRAPYPRPFPCGSLLLGFDRRRAELHGHHLDIATGLCEVLFKIDDAPARLQIFVEIAADRVWLRMLTVNPLRPRSIECVCCLTRTHRKTCRPIPAYWVCLKICWRLNKCCLLKSRINMIRTIDIPKIGSFV